MQALVLLMLLGSGFVPFFVENGWLPGVLTLFPEMISAAATLLLLGVGVRTRFKDIDPAYVFGAAGLVLVMGLAGMARRHMPWLAFALAWAWVEKSRR